MNQDKEAYEKRALAIMAMNVVYLRFEKEHFTEESFDSISEDVHQQLDGGMVDRDTLLMCVTSSLHLLKQMDPVIDEVRAINEEELKLTNIQEKRRAAFFVKLYDSYASYVSKSLPLLGFKEG